MSPHVVRLITVRELRQRLRSKVLLVTTVLIALVLSGAVGAFTLLGSDGDAGPPDDAGLTIAVVGNLTPEADSALDAVARRSGAAVESLPDRAAAESALSDDDVELVVVDGRRVLTAASPGSFLTGGAGLVASVAETLGLAQALAEAGVAGDGVAAAVDAAPLPVAQVGAGDPTAQAGRFGLAYAGVIFLYATFIMYASWIVSGVIEEKGSRVVEILLATVRPRELMAGKVAGIGIVGMAQAAAIFVPPLLVAAALDSDLLPSNALPAVAGIVGWWVVGYVFYAVVSAALGALVSRPEEAQVALTPATVVLVGAFFVGFQALGAPDGTVALVASFVPPTAPIVMLVRGVLTTVPWWQVVLAVASTLAGTAGLTLLAARIYEGGLLKVGGRVKLRTAWRSARS